uniref:Uncharacterized protein n=1 Tax=Xenopus tropicalis TaxID=8364 RepID=A0A6I8SLW7_XENTR
LSFTVGAFSFSDGSSNTHRSLESMRSSGFASFHSLTTASISEVSVGAMIDCTMNLCLLFSLGS